MATTVPFAKVRVSPDAKVHSDSVQARVSPDDRAKVQAALAEAAGVDGNRYLSGPEAQAVADAFETASGSATSALSGAALDGALAAALAAAAQATAAANVDGISAHFSSEESLSQKLIRELYAAVDRAGGRPLDVNMMIFEFQSDDVKAAILDVARTHPEVTFRIVADAGQASTSGGNALPEILREQLPNVQVKFKKDFPYLWSDSAGRAIFNHNSTQGLNHHKGFATFIDGMPDRVVTGSFNWSDTANDKNYEDLVVVHASDAATRRAVEQYQDEFVGFFNDAASLSPNDFANFKQAQFDALAVAHNQQSSGKPPRPSDAYPAYAPVTDAKTFDVNGFTAVDQARLKAIVGSTLARKIASERSRYGRFASFDELVARVPDVGARAASTQQKLMDAMTFGSGAVSVNDASVEELDAAGLSKSTAEKIFAWREQRGDLESVDAATQIPGISSAMLNFARANLNDDDLEGFFNSRRFGDAAPGTGYGALASVRQSAGMDPSGQVTVGPASVTAPVNDLFYRAQPGQQISVAMYSMSPGSKEFAALADAAKRGVTVRVVLNSDFSASSVAALKALAAQGLDVDVRVQSAKTMHEKFGVVGDDVFFGSANFSESSSTKHSEDRWSFKNSTEMSEAFQSQFDRIWEKSRVV